jgi:hypothetical protein
MFRRSEFRGELISNIYNFDKNELNYFIINENKKFSIWQEGNRQDLSIRFWISYQPDSTGIISNKNKYYLNLIKLYYNIIIHENTQELTELINDKTLSSFFIFGVSYYPVYVNFLNMENFENSYGIRIIN